MGSEDVYKRQDKNSISASDNRITQSETQQTLSGSRTGIWKLIAHKDGKADMIFDDVMSDMMGFDRNAPSQDNISRLTEHIADEDRERFNKYIDNLINIGSDEIIYKWNHPTKGMRYIRCGGWKNSEENGVAVIRGYHQDITDIMKQHERNELAVKMMKDAYFRICFVDLNADSIFDLKCGDEKITSDSFSEYVKYLADSGIVEDDYKSLFLSSFASDTIKKELNTSAKLLEFTYRRKNIGGDHQWARSIIVPVDDYSDKNACFIWYVKNISEEKAMEFKAVRSKTELSRMKESLTISDRVINAFSSIYNFSYYIDLTDHTYSQIQLTKLAEEVSGGSNNTYSQALHNYLTQVIEKSYQEKMADFMNIDTIAERLDGKNVISCDYLNVYGKWIRASYMPASRDENGRLTHAVFVGQDIDGDRKKELQQRDVLERAYESEKAALKRSEASKSETEKLLLKIQALNKELESAYTEAKLANTAKTDFLTRMSHDIRTPINGIIGLLNMADKYPDDIEMLKEYRLKEHTAVNHLLSLVNDVLDMAKLESGNIDLSEEPFNINEVIDECFDIISTTAAKRGLKCIRNDPKPIEHDKLIGSPLHVKQILINILSNAVKYNRPNGTVTSEITEIFSDSDNVIIRFSIADTGIGMSEEFQKKMFEPFTQENSGSRSEYHGTGLGMSIIKKLTDIMNGTIEVTSCKDIGSKFVVTLPFKINHDAHAADSEIVLEKNALSGMNILLVEDNELNAEIAQFMLKEEGASVDTAKDGEEAVRAFSASETGHYDVILMDIMMPVMDGCTAAREIRKLQRDDAARIPIIAMTANAFVEDVKKSRAAGMNDHIAKPLDTPKMLTTIVKYVKEYRRK